MTDQPNRKPHKCPACDGWGWRTIFQPQPDSTALLATSESFMCQACKGSGILWEPREITVQKLNETIEAPSPTVFGKFDTIATIVRAVSDTPIPESDYQEGPLRRRKGTG